MTTNQIFTCISSTQTTKRDGYIVKLQTTDNKVVQTAFGTKTQANQTTYYIKLDGPVAQGFKGELDLSGFNIIERPFIINHPETPAILANPATGTPAMPTVPAHEEEVMLKWLQVK